MKKGIILCSVVFLAACAHRHTEPITGKTVNTKDAHIRNGQIVFNTYCQKCHPNGEAGLGPEILLKPGIARRFQVRHGMGVMPAFKKDEISSSQLTDINIYLRNLKHQKK